MGDPEKTPFKTVGPASVTTALPLWSRVGRKQEALFFIIIQDFPLTQGGCVDGKLLPCCIVLGDIGYDRRVRPSSVEPISVMETCFTPSMEDAENLKGKGN